MILLRLSDTKSSANKTLNSDGKFPTRLLPAIDGREKCLRICAEIFVQTSLHLRSKIVSTCKYALQVTPIE